MEELIMNLEGYDEFGCSGGEGGYANLRNQAIYSEKFYMALFRREEEDFEEVFNIDDACPISNKEEEEPEQEEDAAAKDLWSFETKGEKRGKKEAQSEGIKYADYSSESKSWTLKPCKPAGQEEEAVTNKWYSSESPYQEYREMARVYGVRIIEFLKLVDNFKRRLPALERETECVRFSAAQVYQKLQGEDGVRGMPRSEAIKLINLAMWVEKDLDETMHWYRSVERLLSIVPCITIKTARTSKHFAKSCNSLGIFDYRRGCQYWLGEYLQPIFEAIEPVFHPLIRKENNKEIGWLTKRDFRIQKRKETQSSKRSLKLPLDEKRIKCLNEKFSSEAYQDAMKIVQLHQDFDLHLALCSHLNEKSKIKDLMADENVVPTRYRTLDEALIKASLKLRVKVLRKIYEYKRYVTWMEPFLKLEAKFGRSMLGQVMKGVREVHPDFPNLPDEFILDEKQEEFSWFCDLLSEIKRFVNCPVSDRYLIEGIMVCLDIHRTRTIEMRKKELDSWRHDCMRRLRLLKRVWGRRHYEHHAYITLFDENRVNG